MNCCIERCGNNLKKKSECPWLSFHMFPKDIVLRGYWINAIGKVDLQSKTKTFICSAHFKDEDFKVNKQNLNRRLKPGAIPVIDPVFKKDILTKLRVCRICLSIDRRMHPIIGTKLEEMYINTTGRPVSDDEDRLPAQLCWECAAKITAASKLKEQAILTDKMLRDYIQENGFIKYSDVLQMSENSNLKSRFTIDLCKSVEGVDSVVSSNKSDRKNEIRPPKRELKTVQKFDEVTVTVEKIDETGTTLPFESYDPKDIKIEIDTIDNDITDNTDDVIEQSMNVENENDDLKSEIDVVKDNTSNSDGKVNKSDDMKVPFVDVEIGDDSSEALESHEIFEKVEDDKPKVKVITPKNKKKNLPTKPIDEKLYTIRHLSEEEEIQAVVNRQYSERYLKSPYQCTQCYKGFPSEESYERHATKHSEKMGPYVCNICKIRSATKVKAYKHKVGQHIVEISCKQCPFVTRSRNRVNGHTKFHAGNKYKCQLCDQEFSKLTTYYNHLRLRHRSHYVCDLCGYTFVNSQGVITHKKVAHRFNKDLVMEGPYCEVCEVRFLSEQAYDTHLNLSSKHVAEDNPTRMSNDRSKCRKLENLTWNPIRREAIRRRDRNTGPQNTSVSCEQCGEDLPTFSAYVWHFKSSHPGKRRTKHMSVASPYLCEQCGITFADYTSLSSHMWVHTGKKQYQCDHCDKSFSVKGNLSGHMRLHDKSRRLYDCRICGKQYTSLCNMKRHMFLHTGLKPFRCSACDKCFVTAGELKAHVDFVHLKKPRPKRLRARNRKPDAQAGY
ncbi:zinc finger protein 568-like [Trichoplusia ni]|uniref:Zinc finger protein 568-like n=1 Tax=Trichoplusia ni TaxID=7111 RepID=A0A7E5X5Z7_TRINI|nr:zinc finger protein 568-like [Trichoplusia ni]